MYVSRHITQGLPWFNIHFQHECIEHTFLLFQMNQTINTVEANKIRTENYRCDRDNGNKQYIMEDKYDTTTK